MTHENENENEAIEYTTETVSLPLCRVHASGCREFGYVLEDKSRQ